MKKSPTPTKSNYAGIEAAYDYFNRELFGGALRPCLFTMQRNPRAMGYFSGNRFAALAKSDDITDEIALNPLYFKAGEEIEILQTLAHEMVHLWQHHHGKKVSKGYHNQEWAEKMKEIGLQPTDTGYPGGKETGKHMSDYPIENSRFSQAAAAFLATGKLAVFRDRAAAMVSGGTNTGSAGEGEGDQPGGTKKPGRIKFSCPGCGLNAWAKPSAALLCGECEEPLTAAD